MLTSHREATVRAENEEEATNWVSAIKSARDEARVRSFSMQAADLF